MDVERRSDVFSSRGAYRANIVPDETNTIALDDPEHLQQRRIVNRRFTPRAVEDHVPFLQSRIDELIDAVSAPGGSRWSHDLAAQLPSRLTAELLGLPRGPLGGREGLVGAADAHRRADASTPRSAIGMMTAIMEFNTLLVETAAERRAAPPTTSSPRGSRPASTT